jgi:hypothetical protein
LFDENVPRNLRRDLPDFTIRTVQQEGWAGLKNGTLLQQASLSFDVVVTVDQRMRYQQNISSFNVGVVVRGLRYDSSESSSAYWGDQICN